MAVAFSAHLPHFRIELPAGVGLSRLQPLGDPAPDTEHAAGREIIARARQEAIDEAQAEFAAIRAADQADFERRLAENEQRFAATTAEALATRLSAGLADIASALNANMARVLARFLAGAIRDSALAEFSETLSSVLAAGSCMRIRVVGPEALVEWFRVRHAGVNADVDVSTDAAAADLSVTLDDTILETRIAEWMDRVARAVGGAPNG